MPNCRCPRGRCWCDVERVDDEAWLAEVRAYFGGAFGHDDRDAPTDPWSAWLDFGGEG